MRTRHHARSTRLPGAFAAAGLAVAAVGVAAGPAAAAPSAQSAPSAPSAQAAHSAAPAAVQAVGPRQFFTGDVNGVTANAFITVNCLGPISTTSTGHPIAGQTVAVHLAPSDSTKSGGYTGDSADHIFVRFDDAGPSVGLPLFLTGYDLKAAIPTSTLLPCFGPGKVTFIPGPTSASARSFTVAVTYRSIGLPDRVGHSAARSHAA